MSATQERTFCDQALSGLAAEPLVRLAIPPGFSLADAAFELCEAVDRDGEASVRIELEPLKGREDFYHTLSALCRVEPPIATLDQWLRGVHLYQSRVLVLVGRPHQGLQLELLAEIKALVSSTKDLEAPIRAVWVHDLSGVGMLEELPSRVWPGRPNGVPLLDFTVLPQVGLNRAMSHYVDLRVYWESCGQPTRMAHLSTLVQDSAYSIRVDADIDALLNRLFDKAPLEAQEEEGMGAFLRGGATLDSMRKSLKRGVNPTGARGGLHAFEACGVLWQPPGTARMRLTPSCLAYLCRTPAHPLTDAVGLELVRTRLIASRTNPILAQMVMFLASQVETELLSHLRNIPSCEATIESLGMAEDLRITRRRSQAASPSHASGEDDLIDYATFGQLVKLHGNLTNGGPFPIPTPQLWTVATLRNSAVHGKPIRWEGLRRLIETTYQLCN